VHLDQLVDDYVLIIFSFGCLLLLWSVDRGLMELRKLGVEHRLWEASRKESDFWCHEDIKWRAFFLFAANVHRLSLFLFAAPSSFVQCDLETPAVTRLVLPSYMLISHYISYLISKTEVPDVFLPIETHNIP